MDSTARYLQVCKAVEAEFERNRAIYGSKIQCRAGCSECCGQLFQITEIEAAYIVDGIGQLEPEVREELRAKAQVYLEARKKLIGTGAEPEAWGSLPAPGTRLECPALKNGSCTIYEHRPLICRKFGIPLYNPNKPGQVFACELNFADGDEITDGRLVQIQTGIHEQWKQVQSDYNDRGGYRDPAPITVARAILGPMW